MGKIELKKQTNFRESDFVERNIVLVFKGCLHE